MRGSVWGSFSIALAIWYPIASPSRSSSVAIKTTSASFANFFNSFTVALASRGIAYFGTRSPVFSSISMPKVVFGKSRICPLEAMTLYSLFKKFVMVRALAGDSTIIKFFIDTYFK